MNEYVVTVIQDLVYRSGGGDLTEQDIALINTLPITEIEPILRSIYLSDRQSRIRTRAKNVLFEHHETDKFQFCVDMLQNGPSVAHFALCYDLDELDDPRAIPVFTQVVLTNPDPSTRSVAIGFLMSVGDETVLPALIHARDHDFEKDYEEDTVSSLAQRAIERIQARLKRQSIDKL
jgi:HEAT repeat protein